MSGVVHGDGGRLVDTLPVNAGDCGHLLWLSFLVPGDMCPMIVTAAESQTSSIDLAGMKQGNYSIHVVCGFYDI